MLLSGRLQPRAFYCAVSAQRVHRRRPPAGVRNGLTATLVRARSRVLRVARRCQFLLQSNG